MPQVLTHECSDSQGVTTTYTRPDLKITTAEIANTSDGRWVARLYYGPEPGEHDSETVALESTADTLAIQHSLTF